MYHLGATRPLLQVLKPIADPGLSPLTSRRPAALEDLSRCGRQRKKREYRVSECEHNIAELCERVKTAQSTGIAVFKVDGGLKSSKGEFASEGE